MDLARIIAGGTLWSLIARLSLCAWGTVLSIALARWLGPHSFGVFSLAWTLIVFSAIFADFGVSASTSKFVAEYEGRDPQSVRAILRDGLLLKVTVGGLVSASLLALAQPIATILGSQELSHLLRLGAVLVFFHSLFDLLQQILQGLRAFDRYAQIGILNDLARVVLSLAWVALGFGAAGALLGYTSAYAIGSLAGMVLVARRARNLAGQRSRSFARQLFSYSIPLAISSVAFFTYFKVDRLMLGYYVSPEEVGFYGIAQDVIDAVLLPAMAVQIAVQPVVALLCGKGARDNRAPIEQVLNHGLKYRYLVMVPATFGVVLLAKPAISTIWGAEYQRAAWLLLLLSPYVLLRSFGLGGSPFLIAAGKASVVAKLTIVTAVTNVLLNLYFIPRWHAEGAVLTTLVTHGLHILATVFFSLRALDIRLRSHLANSVLKYFLAAFVMLLLGYAASLSGLADTPAGLVGVVLLCFVVYALALVCVRGIGHDDFNIARSVLLHREQIS